MVNYCIICGSPHDEDDYYCLRCIKDLADKWPSERKEVWIDEEPPPHKDDF